MTSWVSRDATHLGVDRIATAPTAQAFYDNILATMEGAAGAPKMLEPAARGSAVGMALLASGSVSAAASLDIVMTAFTAYKNKLLRLTSFIPASDGVALLGRLSTNGGSSYDSGGTDYGYVYRPLNTAGATGDSFGAASSLTFSGAFIGNVSSEGISLMAELLDTTNAAVLTRLNWSGSYLDTAGAITHTYGCTGRAIAQDTDAIRINFSSGNIASGAWELYGWN